MIIMSESEEYKAYKARQKAKWELNEWEREQRLNRERGPHCECSGEDIIKKVCQEVIDTIFKI